MTYFPLGTPIEDVRTYVKQRVLQQMRVVSAQILMPQYVTQCLDADVVIDFMMQNLCVRLKSHVLAEPIGTHDYEVAFHSPRSWWQHFKRDAWIARLTKRFWSHRWPVRMMTEYKYVKGLGYQSYPHAPIALPADKMGEAVIFETFEGPGS